MAKHTVVVKTYKMFVNIALYMNDFFYSENSNTVLVKTAKLCINC